MAWIVCWKKLLILCCFLFSSVCVMTVFAVGVLVGPVAWIVCWMMFLILYCFLLPSVCGDCVSVGVLVGLPA